MKTEKACAACHQTKPRDQFYESQQQSDGLSAYCKSCHQLSLTVGHPEWRAMMAANVKTRRLELAAKLADRRDNGKTCSRCDETKPLTEFYKSYTSADGRQGYCKNCAKEANIARRAALKQKRATDG